MRALLIMLVLAISWAGQASAAQIVPGTVEYSNDTIESGGSLQACVITAAIVNQPAPEIVNFQLLLIGGHLAFKVAVADADWQRPASVAKPVSDADFYTAKFMHPQAFKRNVTTGGQFVGVLSEEDLANDFLRAFLGGGYSIRFKRDDIQDTHTYYIERGPDIEVAKTFLKCIQRMSD